MTYLKTDHGKTTTLVPDFEEAVMLHILSSWHESEVSVSSYIYEHRKEFVEEILADFSEKEKKMLACYFEGYDKKEDIEGKLIENFHMDQDAFLENVYDMLYEICSAENAAYLKTGFPYRGRLSMGDSWLTHQFEKGRLKRELVEEVCGYLRGKRDGFTYLLKILEKRPVDMENWKVNVKFTTGIEELEWSVRAYNCLRRAGITNVGELLELTGEDFLNMSGVNRKTVKEIEDMQDEVRAGWFLNQDRNLFCLDFPFEAMEILLEYGYLFLEELKKEPEEICRILEKEGLEEISQRFAAFIKSAKREELLKGEKVTFVFPYHKLYETDSRDYHIKLPKEMEPESLGDLVLYPYKDRCLAATDPEAFQEMIEKMGSHRGESGSRAMRFLVVFSNFVREKDGLLPISGHQMKYIWPDREKEPEHFVVEAVAGKPGVDFLIKAKGGEEEIPLWSEEEREFLSKPGRTLWRRECSYEIRIYSDLCETEEDDWENGEETE